MSNGSYQITVTAGGVIGPNNSVQVGQPVRLTLEPPPSSGIVSWNIPPPLVCGLRGPWSYGPWLGNPFNLLPAAPGQYSIQASLNGSQVASTSICVGTLVINPPGGSGAYHELDGSTWTANPVKPLPQDIQDQLDSLGNDQAGTWVTGSNNTVYLLNLANISLAEHANRTCPPASKLTGTSGSIGSLADGTLLIRAADGNIYQVTRSVWSNSSHEGPPSQFPSAVQNAMSSLISSTNSEHYCAVFVPPTASTPGPDGREPGGVSYVNCYLINLASLTP